MNANETGAPKQSKALSKKDAANALSVSVKTVERLIARGQLKAFRVIGQVRILMDDLERYIANQQELEEKKYVQT